MYLIDLWAIIHTTRIIPEYLVPKPKINSYLYTFISFYDANHPHGYLNRTNLFLQSAYGRHLPSMSSLVLVQFDL